MFLSKYHHNTALKNSNSDAKTLTTVSLITLKDSRNCSESYSSPTSHCNTSSWRIYSATSCATSWKLRCIKRWSYRWSVPKEVKMKMRCTKKRRWRRRCRLFRICYGLYSNCILDLCRLLFCSVRCMDMRKFWGMSLEFHLLGSSVFLHLLRLTFRFFSYGSMLNKPGNIW